MLLTESYRELNKKLHEENPEYGVSGKMFADKIRSLCRLLQTADVLDYGCGKRTLDEGLGFAIHNYDPCIPGLDISPEPADIVVCTDVLEHIEPESLDEVLADLHRLSRHVAFFMIATRKAGKTLADGRNAHLTVEGMVWWLDRLTKAGFAVVEIQDVRRKGKSQGFVAVMDKGK